MTLSDRNGDTFWDTEVIRTILSLQPQLYGGSVQIKNQDNIQIHSWLEWSRPKREYQWKSGRSAMELARHWFTSATPRIPDELAKIFDQSAVFKNLCITEGWPEYETKIPPNDEEGRNHDLLLLGQVDAGDRVLISIEAKVDESYGDNTIGQYYRMKLREKGEGSSTRVPFRIETLLPHIFKAHALPEKPPWKNIRYQLLTALSGTLIEASNRSCPKAIFLIHEFLTDECDAKKVKKNEKAFLLLMNTLDLIDGEMPIDNEYLYGPLSYPKSDLLTSPVDLYIGKIRTDWGIVDLNN